MSSSSSLDEKERSLAKTSVGCTPLTGVLTFAVVGMSILVGFLFMKLNNELTALHTVVVKLHSDVVQLVGVQERLQSTDEIKKRFDDTLLLEYAENRVKRSAVATSQPSEGTVNVGQAFASFIKQMCKPEAAICIAGQPGRDGKDGLTGPIGLPGQPGIGVPGRDGRDGSVGLPGQPGRDGKDGPPGRDGRIGLPGLAGKDGKAGRNGETGSKGLAGKQGPRGIAGMKGDMGPNGEKGEKGDKGERGVGGLQGISGSRGEKGNEGEKGERGWTGYKGEKGRKGEIGLQGEKGMKGDMGLSGEKGDRGERGVGGLQGNLGPRGEKGERGRTGFVGEKGRQGEIGLQGEKGMKGDAGMKGNKGNAQDFRQLAGLPSQCLPWNHRVLDETWRQISEHYSKTFYHCDHLGSSSNQHGFTPGWYSFSPIIGGSMPESCTSENYCGTRASGWLNGSRPNVIGQNVSRTVCFNWNGDCCYYGISVEVINCGQYYVYNLPDTPDCYLAYCARGQ